MRKSQITLIAGLFLVATSKLNDAEILLHKESNLEGILIPKVTALDLTPKEKQDIPKTFTSLERIAEAEASEEEGTIDKTGGNTDSGSKKYEGFKYPDELPQIIKHSKRFGVEPELLMAIRSSENGSDSKAYGILPGGEVLKKYKRDSGYTLESEFHPYLDEKEKQLCWSADTVSRNIERFKLNNEGHENFISYLASKYAPKDVKNDPNGLNYFWEENVRFLYEKFRASP